MLYGFASFEFDSDTGELRRHGRVVAIEPQPARGLTLLLSRAGDVVTREELVGHIWGADTHVDFNRGLAYCIAQIRTAVGDSGENSRFIQTVPKRGFRFIAPVRVIGPEPEAREPTVAPADSRPRQVRIRSAAAVAIVFALAGAWAARSMVVASRPVVAVSLFDNETGDSRYDPAVHAVSDVVVDRLTQLGRDQIGVIGNASELRLPRSQRNLKAIAQQTGAGFIILGQLQNKGSELSFFMQLISLEDGTHLWARRIARPAGDALQGLDEDAARMLEGAAKQFILSN